MAVKTPGDPHVEYSRRLAERDATVTQLCRTDARLSVARGVTFLAALLLGILALQREISGWVAGAAVVLFVGLLIVHGRVLQRLLQARRAVTHYEQSLARLDDHWTGIGASGSRYRDSDHIYADDLDLFGDGSLFQLLSRARTRLGEDMLADWLRAGGTLDEVRRRQAAVHELRGDVELREQLALLDAAVHDELDQNSLRQWADEPPHLVGAGWRLLAVILAVLTVSGLIGWVVTGRVWMLAAPLLGEILFARVFRQQVLDELKSIDVGTTGLEILAQVLVLVESRPVESALLHDIHDRLVTDGHPPSWHIRRLDRLTHWLHNSLANQFFVPFSFILCLPVHLVHAIERWRAAVGPHIADWLWAVGQFEALVSLAGHAYERPADPFPEVTADGPLIEGKQLGHPLLPSDRCVRNDVCLGGDLRLILVSGSNMSGKSTLLRTVGTNVVLALAGAPVRAGSLRVSCLQVGTAMRVNDSLQDGRSLFYAVVRRLKAVVDLTSGPRPLLFLLDEILQGTNSHDRRVGSEGVIGKLVDSGAIGLVTTHDLALTEIVQSLDGRAINSHFEDHIEGGRMTFDYRIRPGVVQKSNALELMRMMGLDV